jgi:hypothetical protein
VLAVLLEDGLQARLGDAIAQLGDGAPHLRVVVPARVGTLEWLATDEDRARAEASVRALEAEWSLADEAEVEAEPGEADPVQAVDDALRGFAADEILLVGEPPGRRPGGLAPELRPARDARADVGPGAASESAARGGRRTLASGRSMAIPFVVFAGVNLFLLALAALIALLVLLVVWLL